MADTFIEPKDDIYVDSKAKSTSDRLSETGNLDYGHAVDVGSLPPGYYTSFNFLGSMLAAGLSFGAGVGGFSLIAPILSYVNADIGPDPNLVWVALGYTLTSAVGLLLVGRLSDAFGRRWFFVGGSAIALIGSIVCACAKSIPMLIGGEVILGLMAASQLSFPYTLGELLPMKYRFYGVSYCYIYVIPFSAMGPAVAYALQFNTGAHWRWCYYLMIIANAICTACWFFCYHPPTFHEKNGNMTVLQKLAAIDYIGILLYTGGLLLFLMGLSWGGSVYPWKSAHVITTMIVGGLMLIAFTLWEAYGGLKEPLMPLHLFKEKGYAASVLIVSLGASVYYAFALIWPQMIVALYSEGKSPLWIGCAASVPNAGFTLGEALGGILAKKVGKVRWQITIAVFGGAAFLASVASATPDTRDRAIGLMFVGLLFIGWYESITFSLTTILVADQREIGTATGLGGSSRSGISTICSTVYTVILTNRLASTIPAQVPKAIVNAGLPQSSVSSFLTALTSGTSAALNSVEGITPAIISAGQTAYKHASADAYRTVILSTLAFSGIAMISCFFIPNVEDRMTNEVTVRLHNGKENRVTETV